MHTYHHRVSLNLIYELEYNFGAFTTPFVESLEIASFAAQLPAVSFLLLIRNVEGNITDRMG